MPDLDEVLATLREEREAADRRHAELLDRLRSSERPLTSAEAARTLRRGYEQSEAERAAEGGDDE